MDYFKAVLNKKLHASLIDEFECTPQSHRHKEYSEHWWTGLDKFYKEKFNATAVDSLSRLIQFDSESDYLMFILKYGDYIEQV